MAEDHADMPDSCTHKTLHMYASIYFGLYTFAAEQALNAWTISTDFYGRFQTQALVRHIASSFLLASRKAVIRLSIPH